MDANQLQEDSLAALGFAVEFAQVDLDLVSPDQLFSIQRGVRALLNRGRPAEWREPPRSPALYTEELLYLQKRTLDLLHDVATKRGFTVANDLVLTFFGIQYPAGGSSIRVIVQGSPVDLLLYQVIKLLEETGSERLLVCAAPQAGTHDSAPCGRLFIKVTQKRHCSTRCQSRAYMRDYRSNGYAPLGRSRKRGSRHGKKTR
jgi:hypothetical protein